MPWLVQVERCCLVSKNGVTLELPPRSDRTQEVPSPNTLVPNLYVSLPNACCMQHAATKLTPC